MIKKIPLYSSPITITGGITLEVNITTHFDSKSGKITDEKVTVATIVEGSAIVLDEQQLLTEKKESADQSNQ